MASIKILPSNALPHKLCPGSYSSQRKTDEEYVLNELLVLPLVYRGVTGAGYFECGVNLFPLQEQCQVKNLLEEILLQVVICLRDTIVVSLSNGIKIVYRRQADGRLPSTRVIRSTSSRCLQW